MERDEEPDRQRWSSRYVFILAAVGSAVGLGNVWRFPYLVTYYGGGAFLIPYTVCLVAIGMPILLMELALGQQFQGGDVEAFGKMNPHLRGIGMASIFSSMVIMSYYAVIICWSVIYFFRSFYSLPWTTQPSSEDYFLNQVLGVVPIGEGNENGSWRSLMALIFTWICIYFCVFKGVSSAGTVVKFTMPVPVILLIVLMIRVCMLEGSTDGINQYLGQWSAEDLHGAEVWTQATGQVFFTLGVTMGVMTAYSSFNPRNQNIVVDEKFISLGDYFIAFISGFTIYAMLGNTVHECNNADDQTIYGITDPKKQTCDDIYYARSLGLAFVMFPYGLSTIKGATLWCLLFFAALFMLGIDSAFSLVEAATTVIGDTQVALRMHWSKEGITSTVCIILFLSGTLYTFDTGYYWFDIVDHYVNSYCLLFVGCMECVATGWVYGSDDQKRRVGNKPVMIYNIGSFLAVVIGCIVGFGLTGPTREWDETAEKNVIVSWDDGAVKGDVAAGIGVGIGCCIWLVSVLFASSSITENMPFLHKLFWLGSWHGCDKLRETVNRQNHPNWTAWDWEAEKTAMWSSNTMPMYFGFFIKYVDPILLFIMLVNGVRQDRHENYGGYTDSQLALGICIFAFAVFLAFLPMICPVIFMSDRAAQEFEGFDLMRKCGLEPTEWTWMGFGMQDIRELEALEKAAKAKEGSAEVAQPRTTAEMVKRMPQKSGDEGIVI